MGLTGKLAEGRRRKLEEFLEDQLADGERVEASLPMLQTHVGRFAGYYGVVVTPSRVIVVEWGRGVPERPKSVVDAQPRKEVAVESQDSGLLMGKLVLSHNGERWIGLKVPRIHRGDADSVVAMLTGSGVAS
jgi:hypothetical protein